MWAPAYLTMKEAVEILKKCREEINFRPSDYEDMDEMLRIQSEKVAAWKAANPGKTWGQQRILEEDRKKSGQAEQTEAEKYMARTKYPQDLLPEGVKYELMVRCQASFKLTPENELTPTNATH